MRVFVDTNLWVYRLDRREPEKSRRVGEWLANLVKEHDIVLSTQVLVEFRAVISHKLVPALPADDIQMAMEALAAFEVVATDANLVLDAHQLAVAEQLQWFDALIIEAAIRNNCQHLYSEDLAHDHRYGQLTVQNPLAA